MYAVVKGSEDHHVRLGWVKAKTHGVTVSCDCTRFGEGAACKHIWSTIIAADDENPRRVPGRRPLNLIFVVPEGEESVREGAMDLGDSVATSRAVRGVALRPPSKREAAAAKSGRSTTAQKAARRSSKALPTDALWARKLTAVNNALRARGADGNRGPTQQRQIWYRLNLPFSVEEGQLAIDLYHREEISEGQWGRMRPLRLSDLDFNALAADEDRDLVRFLLVTAPPAELDGKWSKIGGPVPHPIPPLLYEELVPRLCSTGRFASWDLSEEEEPIPLVWDAGAPWTFELHVEREGDEGALFSGHLRRNNDRRALWEPLLLLRDGLVIFPEAVARMEVGTDFPWITSLRDEEEIQVPEDQLDIFLDELWNLPALPQLDMPEEWRPEEIRVDPMPRLTLRSPGFRHGPAVFEADAYFDYAGEIVPARERRTVIYDRPQRRVLPRDGEAETAALEELADLGVEPSPKYQRSRCDYLIPQRQFAEIAQNLLESNWVVEAEGRRLRRPGSIEMNVVTEIDWFELRGGVTFDDIKVPLPDLLGAIRRGERMIRLGDGSNGMLPEDWLERYAPLAEVAQEQDDGAVHILPSQTLFLDALLAAEPQIDVDKKFSHLREQLSSFETIEPGKEPRGFKGTLRPYQREGVGWLRFLKDIGFGGCLADDMGLGKTVQVLALLQSRRLAGERGPSLIVAPRSVVHNWVDEAGRFTPRLRTLSYTGTDRLKWLRRMDEVDVLVTTYGTLLRDIAELKEVCFDYAILDEAQAIKNASSQSAKACRLIQADHRLALTGTPVENHLGELWSIFEFLNPGMLGRLPSRKSFTDPRSPDRDDLDWLGKALRPFILRRTKEQVLKDLPPKTEQTLYCELDDHQRKIYNDLRDHYKSELQQRIETVGLKRSKIQVLEALLRLRQASCHPGLINPELMDEGSAKLDTFFEQLLEVLDEGHKVLVFSQFTRLLALVRRCLDEWEIKYEYLDGRTRNRKPKVERFQNDDSCRIFLISLKAGGVGLNLTAADYVYILDPWWNPAVEAQAIDRAHRIGQTKPVIAYRLIARDTVEEKILELQNTKRELADAILAADRSMIRELTAEDLQWLLD